jgi:hypothetical protein
MELRQWFPAPKEVQDTEIFKEGGVCLLGQIRSSNWSANVEASFRKEFCFFKKIEGTEAHSWNVGTGLGSYFH